MTRILPRVVFAYCLMLLAILFARPVRADGAVAINASGFGYSGGYENAFDVGADWSWMDTMYSLHPDYASVGFSVTLIVEYSASATVPVANVTNTYTWASVTYEPKGINGSDAFSGTTNASGQLASDVAKLYAGSYPVCRWRFTYEVHVLWTKGIYDPPGTSPPHTHIATGSADDASTSPYTEWMAIPQ